jgi:uncharacterized short protein YbdD (DUF466 family)
VEHLRAALKTLWHYLREASGENDYARHKVRALADGRPPLTPAEFYVARTKHKYSRINRCC